MRNLVVAMTALILAGCSSPSEGTTLEPPLATSSSTTAGSQTDEAVEPVFSDTVHFLAPPNYRLSPPLPQDPIRVPVPANTDNFVAAVAGGNGAPEWRLPFASSLDRIRGNGTLWMEVEGTVLSDPAGTDCFWQVSLLFELPDGQAASPTFLCVGSEQHVVAPGVRRLDFDLQVDAAFPAGTNMSWALSARATGMAPGSSISLLTGSAEFDSQASILGLQLPVDPDNLLVLRTT